MQNRIYVTVRFSKMRKRKVEKLISGDQATISQFGIKGISMILGIDKSDFVKHIQEMAEQTLADACTPANPRKSYKSDLRIDLLFVNKKCINKSNCLLSLGYVSR